MKPAARLLCPLLLALAGPLAHAAEAAAAAASAPDAAKGATISTNVCAACHSNDGFARQPGQPIIQGQHPEYLVKQLVEFKAGKRDNAVDEGNGVGAQRSRHEERRRVLRIQAAQAGFAKNKEMASLGEKIYRGGIADRSIPACAGCHSPNGAGIPSQYPRLSGQHADYVEAQLKAFRGGRAQEQRGDDRRCRQAQRQRDQGRVRLRGRPALIDDGRSRGRY